MDCDPKALATAAKCFCSNRRQTQQIMLYLLCQQYSRLVDCPVILSDGAGGFWCLVADVNGNIGAESCAGPDWMPAVIADGAGGFWKTVVNPLGNRGLTSVAGPASTPVILTDPSGNRWQLAADTQGNLGATSVP